MLRPLFVVFSIFLTTSFFLFHTATSFAQTKKQSSGIWQLITLKKLLIAQQSSLTKPKLLPSAAVLSTKTFSAEVSPDIQSFLMQEINAYRASHGLRGVQTNAETCNFARIRAEEITHGFNHDGFYNRSANKTMPYKSGTKAIENLALAPNYKDVVQLWAESPTHAANMRSDTVYVCVEKNGDYYAYEGMTP